MRRLGIAVIATATYDAAGIFELRAERNGLGEGPLRSGRVRGDWREPAAVQAEAYAWLTTPSERLAFWSECAGIDMSDVIDGADAAIEYAKRTPRGESVLSDVRRVPRKGR